MYYQERKYINDLQEYLKKYRQDYKLEIDYTEYNYFDPLFFSIKNNILHKKLSNTTDIYYKLKFGTLNALKDYIMIKDCSNSYVIDYRFILKPSIQEIKQIMEDIVYNLSIISEEDKDELVLIIHFFHN